MVAMNGPNRNKIECPVAKEGGANCQWVKRAGSVRDFPSVGLIECGTCHLVAHEKDLRQKISYETGTMHSWASGYGVSLESPSGDTSRRVGAITRLAKEFKIENILDFGSGKGEIIRALKGAFQVKGLEPEYKARMMSIDEGFEVAASSDSYIERSERFDLITLFHVVEHFYEPHQEFSTISDLLTPGGLLIIETPNAQDALLTTYKSEPFSNFTYWSHHPMLHSHTSLASLISSSGLTVIQSAGIQRYGLANHLYWMSLGLPGGHVHWDNLISSDTEKAYEEDLALKGTSDTIWIVAQKPKGAKL